MERILASAVFSPFRFWLSIGIALCVSLLGCESKQPLSIGFIASTSGRAADIGIAARDAVQLAVSQCNAHGGIRGRPVTLIIKDDQQNVDSALKAVTELFAADVAAIVGPMSSVIALAIVPYLNESQMVAVAGTVTTPDLSGRDDYFFRVSLTTREQATRSARYQIDSGDMRRIAVAYDGGNRSFCENWLENFKQPFISGGGDILTVTEFITDAGPSYSEIAQRLLAAGPDGILIIANPMDSAMLCQQIRKVEPVLPITLSNWGATQRLIELGGKAVDGVTVPIVFDWDSSSPSYQRFLKSYQERYRREPGYPGFYAYNAATVVLTALNAQTSGQDLKATLQSIGEFDGLQGKIRFDAHGDVKPEMATMRIVRNRKFVALE